MPTRKPAHTRRVFNETDDKFFDETYDVNFVGDGQFLLTSWRDGHTHIYRYSFNAKNPLAGEAQAGAAADEGQLRSRRR